MRRAASFSVSWCGFVPFGWFGASGLGRQLVARPEISVFRQGPQIWRAVGSSIGRRCRFKNWCLALWGHPRKSGSGSASLKFRFVHRIVGGGINYGASAGAGARVAEQAVMLVAREWTSKLPPANQSL